MFNLPSLTWDHSLFKIGDLFLHSLEVIAVTSATELWSFDAESGRSVRVTLKPSEKGEFADLDLCWNDGKPVRFPLKLSFADLQNIVDVVLDYARKNGIEIKMPEEEL
jgi:hypothetical protein